MKGQIRLLMDESKAIISFDVIDKEWGKLKAYGLAYEAINITLAKCKKINSEITIKLTNDNEIRVLNKKWRNNDRATNVLAFPNNINLNFVNPSKHIGDVIMSYSVIKCEAIQRNIFFTDHMIHLVIHGVLHLCGYNHINKKDEKIMIKHEKLILDEVGIKDPYISYN